MTVLIGDCRDVLPTLPERSFRCCVTSPPYFRLRDYGHPKQIGLEPTPDAYVAALVGVFREVRRVLTDDGTLWLNVGDSYAATTKGSGGTSSKTIGNGRGQATNAGAFFADRSHSIPTGLKPKDLIGIPWRLAFALQANGWWLRSDIVWHKPNPMPESVTDRPTKAHEFVFLLAKSERYFYDQAALREPCRVGPIVNVAGSPKALASQRGAPTREYGESTGQDGRNARTVWTIPSRPYSGAHFATMPPELAQRCVLAGSAYGDHVLDPFIGSGTVGEVCDKNGRRWTGIDLSYADLSAERTAQAGLVPA